MLGWALAFRGGYQGLSGQVERGRDHRGDWGEGPLSVGLEIESSRSDNFGRSWWDAGRDAGWPLKLVI